MLSWIWVVPGLAAVPVLRTVTVRVPPGAEAGPAFCCASGDPPSLTDMIMSTANGAPEADAGVSPTANWTTHMEPAANTRTAAFCRLGEKELSTTTSRPSQAAPPGRQFAL